MRKIGNKTVEGKEVETLNGDLKKAEISWREKVLEYVQTIVTAVILALIIRAFIVQAFKIPSGSMEPTLLVGDQILVNKFIYGVKIPFLNKKVLVFNKPQRGDVIVFTYPVDKSKDFIKRVIAVEGDRIEIIDKKIYINGKLFNDPWGSYEDPEVRPRSYDSRDNFGPYIVPRDHVFVMGDNRDRSYDSRFWGPVEMDKIKGRAFLIYWSWDNGFKIRWWRIGKIIK